MFISSSTCVHFSANLEACILQASRYVHKISRRFYIMILLLYLKTPNFAFVKILSILHESFILEKNVLDYYFILIEKK